jgi:heptosyltransferase III
VLVLRPGALGDTLLAVPALRALRRRDAPITLAAHAGAARLLLALDEVDAALAFDDPRVARVLGGAAVGEPVVAWLDSARAPDLRATLLAPSRPADKTHCARYLLDTLAPLGCTQQLDDTPLRVDALPSGEVLVHPGSGSMSKNWPARCFASLIACLKSVRLIVGEADLQAAAEVERWVGHKLPRLQQPSLEELASRLAGCHAYVGNDSGVSHLAGLSGARAFVLFGPSSAQVWQPLGPRVSVRTFDIEPRRMAEEIAV